MAMDATAAVDVIAIFARQAERVGSVVHRTQTESAAAVAVAALRERSCATAALARALPDGGAFVDALAAAGISAIDPANLWPTRRADAGISVAVLGIAETGSVLLHSTSEDRRVELCVDVHVVVVPSSAIVPTLDDALGVLRRLAGAPAAYASLVSGPSRSADIERSITIGVHGPRELHVLLVDR